MKYNPQNSQRYFFITTILFKYRKNNCIYTKQQLVNFCSETLPIEKNNKYNKLFEKIIYNIENIDNVIQKYLKGDIDMYNQQFINILRCMVGQILYQKTHLGSYMSFDKFKRIKIDYHSYIDSLFSINDTTKHSILTAVSTNIYNIETAPYYKRLYFKLKAKFIYFKKL